MRQTVYLVPSWTCVTAVRNVCELMVNHIQFSARDITIRQWLFSVGFVYDQQFQARLAGLGLACEGRGGCTQAKLGSITAAFREMSPRYSPRVDQTRESGGNQACSWVNVGGFTDNKQLYTVAE